MNSEMIQLMMIVTLAICIYILYTEINIIKQDIHTIQHSKIHTVPYNLFSNPMTEYHDEQYEMNQHNDVGIEDVENVEEVEDVKETETEKISTEVDDELKKQSEIIVESFVNT